MSQEADQYFNLIDEPWVPAVIDGKLVELSIREIFAKASGITSVVGEMPTQEYAITKLLGTILHAAVREFDPNAAEELWAELWDRRDRLGERVDSYLNQVHDRFWLIHPEKPFYQMAGLPYREDKNNLGKLIAEVPDNIVSFPRRSAESLESLSFAEAARWLVHTHAYDTAGIKTGYDGDPRTRAGKVYALEGQSVVGWLGRSGQILIEGQSLADTLVLNFTPVNPAGAGGREHRGSGNDSPIWEQEHPDAYLQPGLAGPSRAPLGPLDVATWQSRRVRLFRTGDRITGAALTYGDNFPTLARPDEYDANTAWKQVVADGAKDGASVWKPVLHNAERSFWPGLATALSTHSSGGLSPLSIRWVRHMLNEGVLAHTLPITLRAIGIEYGSQQALIATDVDDRLRVPSSLITGNPELAAVVQDAYGATSASVEELGLFADNIAQARGFRPNHARKERKELHSSASLLTDKASLELDRAFRAWLRTFTDGSDPETLAREWGSAAHIALERLAYAHAVAAGPRAAAGKYVNSAYIRITDKTTREPKTINLKSKAETPDIRVSSGAALDTYRSSLNDSFGKQVAA